MTANFYRELTRRIALLERIDAAPDSVPYYVLIRPDDCLMADQTYTGTFTAYEMYHTPSADKVREIHLDHYEDYRRPEGCDCPCLYMVRRKCLETVADVLERGKTSPDAPLWAHTAP